jgi:hypothetical protein
MAGKTTPHSPDRADTLLLPQQQCPQPPIVSAHAEPSNAGLTNVARADDGGDDDEASQAEYTTSGE